MSIKNNDEYLVAYVLTKDINYLVKYAELNDDKIITLRKEFFKYFNNDFINNLNCGDYMFKKEIEVMLEIIKQTLDITNSSAKIIFAYIFTLKRSEYKYVIMINNHFGEDVISMTNYLNSI